MANKQIYLSARSEALLGLLAPAYDNNISATIAAGLDALATTSAIDREALIARAITELAEAMRPDERYDPAADPRAEGPYRLLATLLDDGAARAIQRALIDIQER